MPETQRPPNLHHSMADPPRAHPVRLPCLSQLFNDRNSRPHPPNSKDFKDLPILPAKSPLNSTDERSPQTVLPAAVQSPRTPTSGMPATSYRALQNQRWRSVSRILVLDSPNSARRGHMVEQFALTVPERSSSEYDRLRGTSPGWGPVPPPDKLIEYQSRMGFISTNC